jgi:competence ComEA-like helix-hairpin-helix protein
VAEIPRPWVDMISASLPSKRRPVLWLGEGGEVRWRDWPAAVRLTLGLGLDINRATAASLQLLPGIGAGSARRIVRDRSRHGPFAGPEDLVRVKGIGQAKLRRLMPFLNSDSVPASRQTE